jgi:hypothetical protein
MAEPEVEAAWRAEFRRIHARETFDNGNAFPNDPKAAFRWSGDEAEARRLQEEHCARRYDRRRYRRGLVVFTLRRRSPYRRLAASIPSDASRHLVPQCANITVTVVSRLPSLKPRSPKAGAFHLRGWPVLTLCS